MIREAILSENDETLTTIFQWIKAEWIYTFSTSQYEQLLQLKSSIHNEIAKASFIECIVAHDNFVFSEELLKEYIELISVGATSGWNVKSCLEDMNIDAFSKKLNIARRIQERAFMITSFVLIVHPQLNNYIDILDLSVGYPSVEIALRDWAIQTPASAQAIVDRKLVNRNEADVFLELGQEYVQNGYVRSHIAKELYNSFFGQKSPVDVMFMLPT